MAKRKWVLLIAGGMFLLWLSAVTAEKDTSARDRERLQEAARYADRSMQMTRDCLNGTYSEQFFDAYNCREDWPRRQRIMFFNELLKKEPPRIFR